jgi:hypothetical protein
MSNVRDYTFYTKQILLRTIFFNNQLEKQAYKNGCDGTVTIESGSNAKKSSSAYGDLVIGATITPVEQLTEVLLNSSCPDPTVPSVPLDVSAIPGDTVVDISFSAPAFDGHTPILGYSVLVLPDERVVDGTASPITVTGLTNGTEYTFQIVALNAIGASDPVTVGPVTPTSPEPPAGVLAYKFDANNVSGNTIASSGAILVTGNLTNVTTSSEGGGSFYFNGSTAYISFPQTNLGDIITVSAWVKPEYKYSINTLIANTNVNTYPAGFKLGWNSWDSSDNRMFFEGGNGQNGWSRKTDETALVDNDVWQHLTYIVDNVNHTITFYYYGMLKTTINDINNIQTGIDMNREFRIGSFVDNFYKMKGYLGEFFLYNYALGGEEISAHYQATRSRYETPI